MRISSGKIYFWGGLLIVVLTAWNRYSTRGLRTVVDGMREQKMEELRRIHGTTDIEAIKRSQGMTGSKNMSPAHFNPYHKQQEQENQSIK